MTALREQHCLKHHRKRFKVNEGDIVLVQSEAKNRGKWQMAVVQKVFPRKDGVVRAVRIKTGRRVLEGPIQHLYPMELSCDKEPTKIQELNPEAPRFRSRRAAALVAEENIKEITRQEEEF